MHDPMTVAFEIRRPWPQRSSSGVGVAKGKRWSLGRHHGIPGTPAYDNAAARGRHPFPWWKPSSYSPFWVLAGHGFYWPALITIWHVEPDGHDSGEICHHRRQRSDGRWVYTSRWKWHIHHWHFQIHPIQALKRRLFTRCAGCDRHFHRNDGVFSTSWAGTGPRWFRNEEQVYHDWCHSLRFLTLQRELDDGHFLYLIDRITGGEDDPGALEPTLDDLYGHDPVNAGRPGVGDFTTRFNRRRRIEHLVQARTKERASSPPGEVGATPA